MTCSPYPSSRWIHFWKIIQKYSSNSIKKKLAKNIFFFTFCSYALDLWKIRPIQLYKICLTLIISQFIHAVYVGLQNYRIILILVNECHFSNSAHILVSSRHNNLFLSSLSNSFFFFASSTILILVSLCHTTSINVYFVTFLNISHFLFLFLRLRALDYCRFKTLFFCSSSLLRVCCLIIYLRCVFWHHIVDH